MLQRAQTLYSNKTEIVCKFSFNIDSLLKRIESIQNDVIWSTIIIGSDDVDISTLIKKLDNFSWVSQGVKYISNNSITCPFCQQDTITNDFKNKLDKFFDSDYKKKISRVEILLEEYQNVSRQIIENIDIATQDKNDSFKIGKIDIEKYKNKKELLIKLLNSNLKIIEEKKREPERKVTIESASSLILDINEILINANILIEKHNVLLKRKECESTILCNDIWVMCIHESEDFIEIYKKKSLEIDKALNNLNEKKSIKKSEIIDVKEKINEKEKNITSVKPTINEINRFLQSYGFFNFSIQPAENNENYYCIKRDDGTLATDTLSEGEETFLTFLYFIQKAKGSTNKDHVSDKKIIVLDDPVSSLDNTILYVVSAIVKDLSEKILKEKSDVVQLFILTHNVFFHKEASFITGKSNKLKDVNYWFIRRNNCVSQIDSYGDTNPISTSYELLWRELKDNKSISLISIQNIMRRIIENYFGMLGGGKWDYLLKNFDDLEEKIVAKSLFCWINDGSHSIYDDFFIDQYSGSVEKYKEVFCKIFEKSGHISHYNMMMGILDSEGRD